MPSPAETHQALAAAIERVAEVALAVTSWPPEMYGPMHTHHQIEHVNLHDPQSVLDQCATNRARAERHRPEGGHPGAICDPPPAVCARYRHPWPCLDYRDLMADYGIEVP